MFAEDEKITKKEDAYINIKKIADIPHLISYIRKIRNISLFTVDNEPVMKYTWWEDYKNWVILATSLQYLPANN